MPQEVAERKWNEKPVRKPPHWGEAEEREQRRKKRKRFAREEKLDQISLGLVGKTQLSVRVCKDLGRRIWEPNLGWIFHK